VVSEEEVVEVMKVGSDERSTFWRHVRLKASKSALAERGTFDGEFAGRARFRGESFELSSTEESEDVDAVKSIKNTMTAIG
jgi:hypothetical protein